MSETTTETAPVAAPAPTSASTSAPVVEEDDWLTGATACSIENGEDCEACQ